MIAHKQEVPTPPVEKVYEIVISMTPEEARTLMEALGAPGEPLASWRLAHRIIYSFEDVVRGALK